MVNGKFCYKFGQQNNLLTFKTTQIDRAESCCGVFFQLLLSLSLFANLSSKKYSLSSCFLLLILAPMIYYSNSGLKSKQKCPFFSNEFSSDLSFNRLIFTQYWKIVWLIENFPSFIGFIRIFALQMTVTRK